MAARQHGVVAHGQLIHLGIGRRSIQARVDLGRLHRVHLGVYAVGHRQLTQHGRWMAAVLACGSGAALSHTCAATLWGLREGAGPRVHVSAPGRSRAGLSGIALHLPRHLSADDRAMHEDIPVTSVPRTLLDVAGMVRRVVLERAVDTAERLGLLDDLAVLSVIARSRGKRGARTLKDVIRAQQGPPPITKSDLELLFLQLCRDAGLPPPLVNVMLEGIEVDMCWPEHGLVVELDGFAYHRTRKSFEDDRARDAVLTLADYRVIRVTHRMLTGRPEQVMRMLRSLLSRSPERPGGAPRGSAPALRDGPAA